MKKKTFFYVVLIIALMMMTLVITSHNSYALSLPFLKITSNNYSVGDKITRSETNQIEVGQTLQLYVIMAHGNDIIVDNDPDSLGLFVDETNLSGVTLESSNNEVATVDSSGRVTGVSGGTATITATLGDDEAEYTFTVTEKEDSDDSIQWTDFSNAKFELKRYLVSGAKIEISGVTGRSDNAIYYLLITPNANQPSLEDFSSEAIILNYSQETKIFSAIGDVEKYVELNQDLYVSIMELHLDDSGKKILTYGKKIERLAEPRYSDAFNNTLAVYDTDQIVLNFFHSTSNKNRKMQIKIGKITNTSILKKIKENNSTGFADLLKFAKENSGMYDEIVSIDDRSSSILFGAGLAYQGNGNSVINLPNVVDGEYYFMYVKMDNENGKYMDNEAVTLAQASIPAPDKWYLFFYGEDSFTWGDFGNADPTTSGGTLPDTGIQILVWSLFGLAVIGGGTFSYIQYKKNNF